ncbi:MAG: gliding motility-associated C-terminal domain-containing protein, partial [Bacteroidia bacterium]|nr:gliding motility-associated C-terminal domain-containing protein [Bacteroidia bacterium]
ICAGQTANLSANGNGGNNALTYTWASGTAPGTGTAVTASPATTTTYTVTLTDGCGTAAVTDSVVVTVNPLPVLNITTNIQNGCAPVCVDFTVLTMGCPVYTTYWTFPDGTNFSGAPGDPVAPNICFTVAGIYGGTVLVTDTNGCTNTFTNNNLVTVYPVPNADFSFGPQPASVLNPTIDFTDLTTGATISNWDWNFGNIEDSASAQQNPSFTYTDAGTYNVNLIVTTINGCIDSISYPVIIDPEFVIYVPNAFSPNADDVNDMFFPKGLGIDTDNYQMWIYDRWGNMIFTSDEWTKGWNGRVAGHDEIVQQDVYVWKIKLNTYKGEKKSYVGHVTVVK